MKESNKAKEIEIRRLTEQIMELNEEINERKKNGDSISNFTLGDFSTKQFPIPIFLKKEIIHAYNKKFTNYSPVGGIKDLKIAISAHLKRLGNFDYEPKEIIVTSGARPLIYILFRILLDSDETVIYAAPSWNTQHYIKLSNTKHIVIMTKFENNFLMTEKEFKPYVKVATLLILNSPANPSGTIYNSETLNKIFKIISNENKSFLKYIYAI